MLWSSSFFTLLFPFTTSSIGNAELPTDDLEFLGSDATDQSSLTDWLWKDTSDNVLNVGKADMFSPEAELGLDFAEASGPYLSGYSLFTEDQLGVLQVPSVQTDLDLISLSQEDAPQQEEECLGDSVDTLYKRQTCSVDLSKVQGSDPGLCPAYMNNIKTITCCCENAVEYDPETYPNFSPCVLCEYDGSYLDLSF